MIGIMIDPKEFRIGNLVFDERQNVIEVYSIHAINGGHVTEKDDSIYGVKELRGIPLTEEWLRKFGFEKEGNIFYANKTDALGKRSYRIVVESGEFFFQYSAPLEANYVLIKRLQFIYQLQNLYFALTGEDLSLTGEKHTSSSEGSHKS